MLLCLFAGKPIQAQNVHSQLERNLQVQFLKDSLEAEENSFLFNNISLLYTGPGAITLEVNYNQPSSVTVLSSAQASFIELQPNQQHIIPIRFNLNNGIQSTDWFAFTVNLLVKQTGQSIERKFWIRQKAFTKWKVRLPQPNVVIKEQETKAEFWFHVENSGNTSDEYKIDFDSNLEIEMPKKERSFVLAPGQSKILKAAALLNIQQARRLKNESITIYISNKAGEKRALYQKLTAIGHMYTQEVYQWKKMPLTVELGAQTSFNNQSYYTAALNGALSLGKDKSISLNLRTNDFYNNLKTNNSIATAEYATQNWNITGGTIVDFNHFMINGNGLKVRHRTGKDGYIEAAGINSSLYHTNQFDFRTHQVINKKISITNNSFANLDAAKNTNSYLTVNKLHWSINKQNKLTIEAGAGTENIKQVKIDTTLSGPMFGYRFESASYKLSLVSSVNYYSKNFPGFNKGFQYHNHELRYKQNKLSISGYYQADRKIFTSPEDSVLMVLFNTNVKEFGVRSGYQFRKVSASFGASIWQQQQDSAQSPSSQTLKISTSINWMLSQGISLSVYSNAGYVSMKEGPGFRPILAFNNFGSLQAKSFGLHFRYDSGPFYYYEVKQYAQEQSDIRRLQLAPFYDHHFKKLNTSLRLQMNYAQEKPRDYDYLLVSSQILYSPPKLNMDLGLMTRVDVKNNASPLIHFTLRKRLHMPVVRNKESNNFKLVLFKDRNGNNVFDEGDEVIPQANVIANKTWLMTDANGLIDFKNVSKEAISLDLSKITNLKGWMPTHGFIQTIMPDKNTKKVWIPFKESRVITGRMVLMADDNSSITMELSNIRITAADQKGNQYNTLTDADGAFNLSLPAGEYIVSVNPQAFDENFKPVEFSKAADLNLNHAIDLTFEIIQKKRQINIKKSE